MKAPGRFKLTVILIIVCFALLALGEITARVTANTAVEYMLQDKQLHCLEKDGFTIALCPNVDLHLHHPRGFDYRITTNARGERHASDLLAYVGNKKPVWVLGDSIAMGFGVHDLLTFPYLLARKDLRPVVNLGVDGLGARGILMRFQRAVLQHKPPGLVVRILHPSDFADDERDERYAARPLRALLLRGHFQLARGSALYNRLRWFVKYRRVRPVKVHETRPNAMAGKIKPRPHVPAPVDHPTLKYTETLIRTAQAKDISLIFVLYPAWDGSTGLPRADYADLRGLPAFIRSKGGRVLDLGPAFRRAPRPGTLYIPGDGHPSAAGARVFLKELAPFAPD